MHIRKIYEPEPGIAYLLIGKANILIEACGDPDTILAYCTKSGINYSGTVNKKYDGVKYVMRFSAYDREEIKEKSIKG